jgi:hypothetical protein
MSIVLEERIIDVIDTFEILLAVLVLLDEYNRFKH